MEDRTNELIGLVKILAEPLEFNPNRIWIGRNSYGEYEMEIDNQTWCNCYSYPEAKQSIYDIFKGIELGREV